MNRINHEQFKNSDEVRRIKDLQRANSNWGKKPSSRIPIPKVQTRSSTTPKNLKSNTNTTTNANANASASSIPVYDGSTDTFRKPTEKSPPTTTSEVSQQALKPIWNFNNKYESKSASRIPVPVKSRTTPSIPSTPSIGRLSPQRETSSRSLIPRPVTRPSKVDGSISPSSLMSPEISTTTIITEHQEKLEEIVSKYEENLIEQTVFSPSSDADMESPSMLLETTATPMMSEESINKPEESVPKCESSLVLNTVSSPSSIAEMKPPSKSPETTAEAILFGELVKPEAQKYKESLIPRFLPRPSYAEMKPASMVPETTSAPILSEASKVIVPRCKESLIPKFTSRPPSAAEMKPPSKLPEATTEPILSVESIEKPEDIVPKYEASLIAQTISRPSSIAEMIPSSMLPETTAAPTLSEENLIPIFLPSVVEVKPPSKSPEMSTTTIVAEHQEKLEEIVSKYEESLLALTVFSPSSDTEMESPSMLLEIAAVPILSEELIKPEEIAPKSKESLIPKYVPRPRSVAEMKPPSKLPGTTVAPSLSGQSIKSEVAPKSKESLIPKLVPRPRSVAEMKPPSKLPESSVAPTSSGQSIKSEGMAPKSKESLIPKFVARPSKVTEIKPAPTSSEGLAQKSEGSILSRPGTISEKVAAILQNRKCLPPSDGKVVRNLVTSPVSILKIPSANDPEEISSTSLQSRIPVRTPSTKSRPKVTGENQVDQSERFVGASEEPKDGPFHVIHVLDANDNLDAMNEEMGLLSDEEVMPNPAENGEALDVELPGNLMNELDCELRRISDTLLNPCFPDEVQEASPVTTRPILNTPDLPVDVPTMDPRLSVPKKIVFVKKGYCHYLGKFVIENVSSVNMTYRVYSSDCTKIVTTPEMGILGPNQQVELDVECNKKLSLEKIGVFGMPIYSNRQLNLQAINVLWKGFRTIHFPEKCAEEHHSSLVAAKWCYRDDLNIFQNGSMTKWFGYDNKPLDWTAQDKINFSEDNFGHFWIVDNDIFRKLRFDNEQTNWSRCLEKLKIDEKQRQWTMMKTGFALIFLLLLFVFVVMNFWGSGWFNFWRRETPKLGWFSWMKSWFVTPKT